VVTTQIAGGAPGLGGLTLKLMGAEDGVGVVTFARFYAAHVLLLPPITVLLIFLHVYLVRRHGVAPIPGDEAKPKKKFYPGQAFKDTVAVFIAFAALFTLAAIAKAPLGRLADPTDISYIPRPEWYFLFLFQTLKYFEGPLEVLASVVLPGLGVLALMLVPFIDRGAIQRVTRRTTAIGVATLAIVGWTGLTVAAIRSTPPEALLADADGPAEWRELSPEELAGVGFFRQENCVACHALGVRAESKVGPNLGAEETRRDAGWMIAHFKQPARMMPGSQMPPISLGDSQLNALAAFLLKLTPVNAVKLADAPSFAVQGALIYQRHRCSMCHKVNGVGMSTGPSLNGLGRRRTQEWVMGHFLEPQKYSPGSAMPPYPLSRKDNERLTSYLMSLP
jgi:ubiquinol-cytochrome c reductase cytochrome b subunit